MPTTFMGRDNNNNPCYHVRKGNGLSVADMKAGVQDDTLFHSSLPYLKVLHTETSGKSSTLNWTYSGGGVTHYYDIFNLSTHTFIKKNINLKELSKILKDLESYDSCEISKIYYNFK